MSDQHNLYTLAEASQLTGLSTEALRLRIKRGKLEAERGNDGQPRVRLTSANLDDIRRQLVQHKPTLTRQSDAEINAIKVLEAAVGALKEQADRERATMAAEAAALRERAEKAETRADLAQVEAAAERTRAEEARVRAAAAEGELKGLAAGAEHLHEELARMRREVAESHNRAVTAEQMVLDAVRQREGAEQALARARKWNFINLILWRNGKGRS